MIRYPGTPKHKSVLISSFDLDYFAEPPVFIFHEIKPRRGVSNYPVRWGYSKHYLKHDLQIKLSL